MNEQTLVTMIAAIVVVLCVIGVVLASIREKRRTGRLPDALRPSQKDMGWFGLLFFVWLNFKTVMPKAIYDKFVPLYVIVPAVDVAMEVAFFALAVYALSYAFRTGWSRQIGLWITYMLILPIIWAAIIYDDFARLASMTWLWMLVALASVFLIPLFTRGAYEEFILHRPIPYSGREDQIG
jgi:hypothetical protein